MSEEWRVWDENHGGEIIVTGRDEGGAELWCTDNDGYTSTTIKLNEYGVRQLRLALQHIERGQR